MEPCAELLARWDAAAAEGALRSSPETAQLRVLPGTLGVLVLVNDAHRLHKRSVDLELLGPTPASQISSGERFTFDKANAVEYLCGLSYGGDPQRRILLQALPPDVNGTKSLPQHAVLVNVSPLMRGHMLFVFDVRDRRPQELTQVMLERAMQIGVTMSRADFHIAFNSAGAWASVNHCHFHGFWMAEATEGKALPQMPILAQERQLLFRVWVHGVHISVHTIPTWPMGCYIVQADPESLTAQPLRTATVAVAVWRMVRHLQRRHTPHNLLISWRPTLTVLVFPRQPQREQGSSTSQLRFAVAEVAGLVVCSDRSMFNQLTQSEYEAMMRDDVSLPSHEFVDLTTQLKREMTLE